MTVSWLVRRARRRFLENEALTEATHALSVALALIVLLLILGTEVLDWRWLAAIPAAALGIGLFRLLRRMPDGYAIAQRIDTNLKLSDTLSTAYYYLNPSRPPAGSDSMRASQSAIAERMAAGISLEQALPFQMPRAMYAVAFLAVLASGLFGLRYGFTRSLDLRPPLANVIQDAMGWEWAAKAAGVPKTRPRPKTPEGEDMIAMDLPDVDRNPGELDPASDEALQTVGVPETDPEKYGGEQTKGPRNAQMEGEGEQGEEPEDADASAGSEGAGDGDQSDAKGKQPKDGKPSPANRGGENSSLMAKLKEAMQNMLSRMKQDGQEGAQQGSQEGKQAKQQGKGGQKGGKQGAQQKGDGQESEGSEDGQAGDEAEMAQNPQGKGSGQSPDEAASKQPGSGIGKQDGDKQAQLAEQLEAMGKISQIIGKRSANVTGEITIEVQNTSQQLKTPYSSSGAQHREASGEIARDEVPVMYQTYVQQYFEHVRKQAPAAQPAQEGANPGGPSSVEPPSAATRQPVPSSRPAGR